VAAHMCNGERGVCSKHRQVADAGTVPASSPNEPDFDASCPKITQLRRAS